MDKSAETSPPERQAYLEEIFSSAVDAIVVINERGIVEDVNPATTQLFGFEKADLIGSNVSVLMPSPFRQEHDGYLNNYASSGIRKIIGIGREVVGQRKDGSMFPMHLAVSEIRSQSRRLFVGVVRDISDLKAAEQRLRTLNDELEDRVEERTAELRDAQAELVRAEKLSTLGQVSGGIAHEIRNPLNVVKTSTYFLCNAKTPSKEKVQEHLSRIDRQVNLIDNVVTALSDVARMPDPSPSPCNLFAAMREAKTSVQMPDNIQFNNRIQSNLPQARVDENQIQIVFRNLLRNARDAMPEGGAIDVSASELKDQLLIHVEDQGVGISAEELEKITEPLYSTKARGMGLGLAISLAILQKNGGEMAVKSEVGVGTRFTVVLPLAGG